MSSGMPLEESRRTGLVNIQVSVDGDTCYSFEIERQHESKFFEDLDTFVYIHTDDVGENDA